MTFPWLGLISILLLSSTLARCNRGCTPILGHRPTYGPCSFQTNVSISPLTEGHLAAVCSRSFPISHSLFKRVLHKVRSLWNCSGYLAFFAALHHFLPSCLVHTGNTFSPTPIPPVHSPNRELCLFSLSSLCCPWGYVTVFCNAGN